MWFKLMKNMYGRIMYWDINSLFCVLFTTFFSSFSTLTPNSKNRIRLIVLVYPWGSWWCRVENRNCLPTPFLLGFCFLEAWVPREDCAGVGQGRWLRGKRKATRHGSSPRLKRGLEVSRSLVRWKLQSQVVPKKKMVGGQKRTSPWDS